MWNLEDNSGQSVIKAKVMLMGEVGVGKSSFMLRYVYNEFNPLMQSTNCVDLALKRVTHENRLIRLDINDPGGQETYRAVARNFFKNTNIVVAVYEMTKLESLDAVFDFWYPTAKREARVDAFFYLFGNKSDLVKEEEKSGIMYYIDKKIREEEEEKGIKFIEHVQGSCKDGTNLGVSQLMERAVTDFYESLIEKEKQEIATN